MPQFVLTDSDVQRFVQAVLEDRVVVDPKKTLTHILLETINRPTTRLLSTSTSGLLSPQNASPSSLLTSTQRKAKPAVILRRKLMSAHPVRRLLQSAQAGMPRQIPKLTTNAESLGDVLNNVVGTGLRLFSPQQPKRSVASPDLSRLKVPQRQPHPDTILRKSKLMLENVMVSNLERNLRHCFGVAGTSTAQI